MDHGYDDAVVYGTEFHEEYGTAFIGVTTDGIAVYDYDKMVEWLVENEHVTVEEAFEWLDANTLSAYFPNCPIVIYPATDDN